jgi:hypothetical protein
MQLMLQWWESGTTAVAAAAVILLAAATTTTAIQFISQQLLLQMVWLIMLQLKPGYKRCVRLTASLVPQYKTDSNEQITQTNMYVRHTPITSPYMLFVLKLSYDGCWVLLKIPRFYVDTTISWFGYWTINKTNFAPAKTHLEQPRPNP